MYVNKKLYVKLKNSGTFWRNRLLFIEIEINQNHDESSSPGSLGVSCLQQMHYVSCDVFTIKATLCSVFQQLKGFNMKLQQ